MNGKNVAIVVLCVVLGLTLLIGVIALTGKNNEVSAAQQVVAQKSSDIVTVTEQLQAKTTEVNDLNTKVTNLTTERNDLATTLTARNDELNAAYELAATQAVSLTALTEQLNAKDTTITDLNEKVGDLQSYQDAALQPVNTVVSYTLLGPDGLAIPVVRDLTLTADDLVAPESTPIFDLGVVTYTSAFTNGDKYNAVVGYVHDRGNPQEPSNCGDKDKDEYGLCPLSFDVSSIVLVGGAGYRVGENEVRLFRADKDEYAFNIFINVTTKTLHVSMWGYPGSNVVHGWSAVTGTLPTVTDTINSAQQILIDFKTDAFTPGNCDPWGCAGVDPSRADYVDVGYTVWGCSGNDTCEILYSYNPAQDPSDTRFMPRHDEYVAIVKQPVIVNK